MKHRKFSANAPVRAASDPRDRTPDPALSIVIPMHNESGNLEALFHRLQTTLLRIGLSYEVICVDDGSTDGTIAGLLAHQTAERNIRVIKLSRNYGKEMAVLAGLHRSRGAATVIMDADLQHPPELLERFVARWREGYQVVYGERRSRAREPLSYRWPAQAFYWIFKRLAEVPLPPGVSDFRLIDRVVREAIMAMPEKTRFLKGLFSWVGYRQIGEPFDVSPRVAGQTGWGFYRLFSYALDAFTGFSSAPLRAWLGIGAFTSLSAVLSGLFIMARAVITGSEVSTATIALLAVLFLGGGQLLGIGVLGEYVGRIFTEVRQRPTYLVDREYEVEDSILIEVKHENGPHQLAQ